LARDAEEKALSHHATNSGKDEIVGLVETGNGARMTKFTVAQFPAFLGYSVVRREKANSRM
jgi:hypothetical protein